MAVRVVIDTNIWISAVLNPFGFPAKVREAFEVGLFRAVISEPMMMELAEVLQRPRIKDKYGISQADISDLLLLIEEKTEQVVLIGNVDVCRDPDDNFIIETAVKGRVQYLVTRDDDIKWDMYVTQFLSQYGIIVVSISKFLSILGIYS